MIPTNWYYKWRIFWHYIWHSIWYMCLFYLYIHSDIACVILSGILFGILSDILYSSSLRWTWRPKKIHPYIFSIFNVHVNEQESTFYLAFSLTWCIFWHSIWNSLWHSIWHLALTVEVRQHWHLALAVDVRTEAFIHIKFFFTDASTQKLLHTDAFSTQQQKASETNTAIFNITKQTLLHAEIAHTHTRTRQNRIF